MRRALAYIALLALSTALGACITTGTPLKTLSVINIPDDGRNFTLIYYVGIDKHDPRRAVFLDIEADGFEFVPALRDFEYEILQDVSMEEALYETEIFFEHEPQIESYSCKSIISPSGKVMGYEFRPFYRVDLYGETDILKIEYNVSRKRVIVDINLKSGIKPKGRFY